MNERRHELGGRVLPGERRVRVEIRVIDIVENAAQLHACQPDIDQQVGAVDLRGLKLGFHCEGRAMEFLRGTELGAAEAVRDHDVIAHCQAVHRASP